MSVLRDIRDPASSWSIARRTREKRFRLFIELLSGLPEPIRILDLGGTQGHWETLGFDRLPDVTLLIANLEAEPSRHPRMMTVSADARNLSEFSDNEFDVVFSNSVIEHVGDFSEQRAMADEIMRVGKRYFVQTPNRFFPIEPHFMFPGFQFLSIRVRTWLLMNLALAWSGRIMDPERAERAARSIELLSRKQMESLFPGATMWEERLCGLTKSFVCYDGWS